MTPGSAGSVAAQQEARRELLYIALKQGSSGGLGLELDSTNLVSFIVRAASSLCEHRAGKYTLMHVRRGLGLSVNRPPPRELLRPACRRFDPFNHEYFWQVSGGAADQDGQILSGDTIVSVNGVQLNGLLLQVHAALPHLRAALHQPFSNKGDSADSY
jgi:hypothetical protein